MFLQNWYLWCFQGGVIITRALTTMVNRTMVHRFVGGLAELPFVED